MDISVKVFNANQKCQILKCWKEKKKNFYLFYFLVMNMTSKYLCFLLYSFISTKKPFLDMKMMLIIAFFFSLWNYKFYLPGLHSHPTEIWLASIPTPETIPSRIQVYGTVHATFSLDYDNMSTECTVLLCSMRSYKGDHSFYRGFTKGMITFSGSILKSFLTVRNIPWWWLQKGAFDSQISVWNLPLIYVTTAELWGSFYTFP